MSLKFGILGLLHYGPQTGYEITQYFKNSLSFFWPAQTSQIYRELSNLEKEGYAVSEVIIQYDKPNKRLYHITDSGRKALLDWLSPQEHTQSISRSPFLMKLFFSAMQEKEKTIEVLQRFIEERERELEKLAPVDAIISDSPFRETDSIYWNMTLDFGKKYNQMCIDWAKEKLQQLEDYQAP